MKKLADEELKKVIQNCIAKDLRQFDYIYDAYYHLVYYTAYQFFHDASKAEDVLQNTFLEVYRKIYSLKDADAFSSWIRRITYCKCMDVIRYEKKDALFYVSNRDEEYILDQGSNQNSSPVDKMELDEAINIVKLSLSKLDEKKRMIGYLRFLEGYTAKSIAEVMNMNVNSVNTHIRRIQKHLKKCLVKANYCPENFLAVAAIPLLSDGYQSYLSNEPEIAKRSFHLSSKPYRKISWSNTLLAIIIASICGGFILFITSNKEMLSYILSNMGMNTTKIKDIEYVKDITKFNIALNVETTNANYDDIYINGKKTLEIECNGVYVITLLKDDAILDKKTIVVDNIDKNPPFISKKIEGKDYVEVYIEDNMELNLDYVEVYKNDVLLPQVEINKTKHFIQLEKDLTIFYQIRVADKAGNTSDFYINFKE